MQANWFLVTEVPAFNKAPELYIFSYTAKESIYSCFSAGS